MIVPSSHVFSQEWRQIDLLLRASNEGRLPPFTRQTPRRQDAALSQQTARCASIEDHQAPSSLFHRTRSARKKGHLIPPPATCGHSKLELETVSEARCTRVSFKKDPGGVEDSGSQPYCTSTLTEWVAMTGSWSFVAPVTVTLCGPLLRLLISPEKPFWYSPSTYA